MKGTSRGQALAALTLAGLATLAILALSSEFSPAPHEQVATRCREDATELSVGQPFTVLSWNLQYGAGRGQHFFYDGGEAVHVPDAEVSETVAGIVAAMGNIAPDIALLQEVDRGSTRTGNVDQLPAYAAGLEAQCEASTPYHRSPFVPHPLNEPMGRVDMHLALLSGARLQAAFRHALPLLEESRLRQMFNLKRALLVAELPIADSELPLAVAVSHLSAFSGNDGTLPEQIGVLNQWMDERPANQPWILGADLNALPPDDEPARLGEGLDSFRGAQPAMQALLSRHSSTFPAALAPEARTWLPYGATVPDRKIDWLFYGGPLELLHARVAGEFHDLSDHLPLVARFRIAVQSSTDATGQPPI